MKNHALHDASALTIMNPLQHGARIAHNTIGQRNTNTVTGQPNGGNASTSATTNHNPASHPRHPAQGAAS